LVCLHARAVKVVVNPLKTYLWQAIMQWFLPQMMTVSKYRLNYNLARRHNFVESILLWYEK